MTGKEAREALKNVLRWCPYCSRMVPGYLTRAHREDHAQDPVLQAHIQAVRNQKRGA